MLFQKAATQSIYNFNKDYYDLQERIFRVEAELGRLRRENEGLRNDIEGKLKNKYVHWRDV
jgi:hypothetical protein